MSFRLIAFLFIIYLHFAASFIDLSYFRTFLSNLVDERRAKYANVGETESTCDSNQIMLHLAKKCITSPEKILLLLAADSLDESCKDISDTIHSINQTQRGCIALPSDHLYMKLLLATQYFYSSVCQNASTFRKEMTDTMDCLHDLHDEFLECEGPPDWYENKDRTIRCSIFNDIIKCNYLKAAQICGLESGGAIRSFAVELLQLVQPTEAKCEASRSLSFSSAGYRPVNFLAFTPLLIRCARQLLCFS